MPSLQNPENARPARLTRDTCDEVMQIPMAGSVESLNVSVASGVCLFEAVRQRSVKKSLAGLAA